MSKGGLKIGQIMSQAGVTRATVHHYVKEGLLPAPIKTSRNMALYDEACVERVRVIKVLQQGYRRSLAEVKALLAEVNDAGALARLSAELQSTSAPPPLPPTSVRLWTEAEAAERSGYSIERLRQLREDSVLGVRVVDGERFYPTEDVDVAIALHRLAEAGFGGATGFEPRDALVYVDALRDLLKKEIVLLLRRSPPGESPAELLERAKRGITRVDPLLLAIRRKLIREAIDAATVPQDLIPQDTLS